MPPVRAGVAVVLGRRLRRRFEVARRRLTVRGEVLDGVTVTTWVDDEVHPAVEPPPDEESRG